MSPFLVWAVSGALGSQVVGLIAIFLLSGSLMLFTLIKQRSSSPPKDDLQQCQTYYYGTDVDPTSFHNSPCGGVHTGSLLLHPKELCYQGIPQNETGVGQFASKIEMQDIEQQPSPPLIGPHLDTSPVSEKKHTAKKKVRFSKDVVEPLGNGKDYRTRMIYEISSRRRKRAHLRDNPTPTQDKRKEEKSSSSTTKPASSTSSSSEGSAKTKGQDDGDSIKEAEEVMEWNMQLLSASPFAYSQQSALYFSRNDQYHLISTIET